MGGGSFTPTDWGAFKAQKVQGKTTSQVFSSRGLNEDLDPTKFKNGIRESVDGPDHPQTTPVAVFTDCTASMGQLAHSVIKKLDVVCQSLLDRAPVPDVHLMTGVVGDAYSDSAPIQASQFESDIRIAEQTAKLFLEGNGGGNGGESYALPWLMLAHKTTSDSFNKRGKKGYCFTVGDEGIHGVRPSGGYYGETINAAITKEQAKQFLDIDLEADLSAQQVLDMVSKTYHVYHIVVETGRKGDVQNTWEVLMPDRLIYLEANNIDLLPEIIVSTIEINEGRDAAKVAASWGGNTSIVVANATRGLVSANNAQPEVVRL
jgi:hypothetical protein